MSSASDTVWLLHKNESQQRTLTEEGIVFTLCGQKHVSSYGRAFRLTESVARRSDHTTLPLTSVDLDAHPEYITFEIHPGCGADELPIEVGPDAMQLVVLPKPLPSEAFVAVLWKGEVIGVSNILEPLEASAGDPERCTVPVTRVATVTGDAPNARRPRAWVPQLLGSLEYRCMQVKPTSLPLHSIQQWTRTRAPIPTQLPQLLQETEDDWCVPRTTVLHRGFGQVNAKVNAAGRLGRKRVRENSMQSIDYAAQHGIDFIEVDVQLTRDRIPIIFHDFDVNILGVDRTTTLDELVSVPVAQVTFRQLHSMRILENKVSSLKRLILKHWNHILPKRASGNLVPCDMHTPTVNNEIITLRCLLDRTPEHIGINLEVKYPKELSDEHRWRNLAVYKNMDAYVDKILQVTLDSTKTNRRIVYSSFDPDVCMLLRLKQSIFPVLFLTVGTGTDLYDDARCFGLETALSFAKAAGLRGVVCNTACLRPNAAEIIQTFLREKKWLWTWGSENNDPEWAQLLHQNGIGAVISDAPCVEHVYRR